MADKISGLSAERVLAALGRLELPGSISPEKIIIYGVFLIGIVAFVNWFLSFTAIILKPVLYSVLMLIAIRPEVTKFVTNDSTMIRMIETMKAFLAEVVSSVLDLVQGWQRNNIC